MTQLPRTSPIALVAFAALLAGCASGQGSNAVLPGQGQPQLPNGATGSGPVAIWVTSRAQSEIFGQDRSGKNTVATIDGAANGCYGPSGVKVDHQGRLWVACYTSDYGGPVDCGMRAAITGVPGCIGSVQMYAHGAHAAPVNYPDSRCDRRKQRKRCYDWSGAAPNDVAFDSLGDVFAATPSSGGCSTSVYSVHCGHDDSGAYSYWLGGKAPRHLRFVAIDNLFAASYVDVDENGTLYVTGYTSSKCTSSCQTMIDEIKAPTSRLPVIMEIIGPTTDQLDGVYVSNGGSVLNVVDETARTIDQYALPWVANETPFNVLGPTLERMGHGAPTSGGFDRSEKHLVLGDADGWIDVGNVAVNHWSAVSNTNLSQGNYGAAYVPSDK